MLPDEKKVMGNEGQALSPQSEKKIEWLLLDKR